MTNATKWLSLYGDYLYAYALMRVNHKDTAEDLVQETLLAGLESLDRFSNQSSEKTWLVAILKHKILDYWRKKYRHKDIFETANSVLDGVFTQDGQWAVLPGQWGEDASAQLEDEEFLNTLQKCLLGLPEQQRCVFESRLMDDAPTEELCMAFSLSVGNLGVLIHRARHAVRGCLEKKWFQGELAK
jgi:RNA polymerase sigma-70 factor (TIGR02943 family)